MSGYKVLVPLDGSRTAEQALAYLDPLRSLGESQIRLLSVVDETLEYYSAEDTEALDRETTLLATYLQRLSVDIQARLGIRVETSVVYGSPATRILEDVHAFAPDLLLISTHGRSGLSRWRLGSVADKVIRAAQCHTLVIGPKAAASDEWLEQRIMPTFKSILVPLDGSDLAEQALDVAQTIAECFGSKVHLVRVVPVPIYPTGFATDAYIPDLIDALTASALTYVTRLAARFEPPRLTKVEVMVGGAATRLEDYIEGNAVDLVVMTTHGRGGFMRTALGSVTDRLIGGPAPVLVVRPKAHEPAKEL